MVRASEMGTGTSLTARGIVKSVGARRILRGVDIDLTGGSITGLVGPSGCGKTTLLSILACAEAADSGTLTIGGHTVDLTAKAQLPQFCGRASSIVMQNNTLLSELTLIENVALPLIIAGAGRKASIARAIAAVDRVGMLPRRRQGVESLSGGERQKVAIARAIVIEPACVFLDEPTGNLDQTSGRSILRLLLEIASTVGTAFFIASHDKQLVDSLTAGFTLRDGVLDPI